MKWSLTQLNIMVHSILLYTFSQISSLFIHIHNPTFSQSARFTLFIAGKIISHKWYQLHHRVIQQAAITQNKKSASIGMRDSTVSDFKAKSPFPPLDILIRAFPIFRPLFSSVCNPSSVTDIDRLTCIPFFRWLIVLLRRTSCSLLVTCPAFRHPIQHPQHITHSLFVHLTLRSILYPHHHNRLITMLKKPLMLPLRNSSHLSPVSTT